MVFMVWVWVWVWVWVGWGMKRYIPPPVMSATFFTAIFDIPVFNNYLVFLFLSIATRWYTQVPNMPFWSNT